MWTQMMTTLSDGGCGDPEETPDLAGGQGRLPGGGASKRRPGGKQKTGKGEGGIRHSRRGMSKLTEVENIKASALADLCRWSSPHAEAAETDRPQRGDEACTGAPCHLHSPWSLRTHHSLWPPRRGALRPQSAVVSALLGAICYYSPSALPACVHSSVMSLTLLSHV